MKKEKTIQKLLGLGFRDKSYSADDPSFELDINGFSLLYEKGKFKLEGNGGYDDSGEMELDHFKIENIKPLYKLLTGKILEEVKVSFNYKEWQENLEKEAKRRNKNFDKLGLLSDMGRFPGKELHYLDALINMADKEFSNKFEWSELQSVSKSNDIPKS